MRTKNLLSLGPLLSLGLCLCFVTAAQPGPYRLMTTIPVPGGLTANDISWVDSANARYYLADRGNANAKPPILPRIDVIDTEHDVLLGTVNTAGSNGVVAVPRAHELWVGDSDSTVKVIDTDALTVTHTISTGGKARADEIAYDPVDHVILIANDRDTPPFVTFLSATTYTVLKSINYDGIAGPQSTGGIEQPVWDGPAGKFYIAIPSTKANPNGEVDELDPLAMTVTRNFPTSCGPAGLVLISDQRLMTSCGDVVDVASGKVLSTIAGVGGDEIWYNPGDEHVYFGGGTNRVSISVVDAVATKLLTTLTVGQIVAAPGVSHTTHSVAADSANNQIFVPVTNTGVQVWTNGPSVGSFTANPNPVPVEDGVQYGMTTLSWNAPGVAVVEVHIGSPSGPVFATSGWDGNANNGSAQTGLWVADGMTFYLQDISGGKPLTAANTLATVVIHLKEL